MNSISRIILARWSIRLVLENTAMIRSRVALVILGPALAVACAVAAARADDSRPEDVLKSHGLSVRRGGSTYVLAAESEIQLKLNEAQRIFKQLSCRLQAAARIRTSRRRAEEMVPGLLEERIVLSRQLQAVNRQDVILHNQLAARFNEINDQLGLLEVRTGDPRRQAGHRQPGVATTSELHPGDPRPPRACRLDHSPIRRAGPG